jgi:hypothetical protein
MLDLVDRRGQRPLVVVNNPAGHLLRGKTRVLPGDGDDGDVDIGENINGRPDDRNHAQDQDQNRGDDERIGTA